MTTTQRAERMSEAAVQARTGKTWPEWFAILDLAGAQQLDHKGIVAYLHQHHPGLGGWWGQMVTVTYEQERGLREKHQTPTGYQVSVSKTLEVPVSALYQAWQDDAARGRWLPEATLIIRKATPDKSLRIGWSDGTTSVDVNLYHKGEGRTQVTVQHSKLRDADEAAEKKAYWADALDRLKHVLEA